MTPQTCSKCSSPVHPETYEFNESLCDHCFSFKRLNEVENKDEAKKTLELRLSKWAELCPLKYRDSDCSFMPHGLLDRVMAYKPSKRGLLCLGDSQLGKTTACWKLLEKLHIIDGIKFAALTEPEFSVIASKKSRLRTIDEWLRELCNIPLFFLDDIGHSATTSKHMEELFYVIDQRVSWKRPIIATTQFTSEELIGKAKGTGSEKTALAIINRLRQSCEIVVFSDFKMRKAA
jgi:hypothetical protein